MAEPRLVSDSADFSLVVAGGGIEADKPTSNILLPSIFSIIYLLITMESN